MLLDSILSALQLRRTPKRTDYGHMVRRPRFEALEERLTLSFSAPTSFPLEFGPADALSADFNHDGRLDLATVWQSVNLLLGDGQGGFGAPSQFGFEDHSWTGVTADFNHDGHPDLATLNNDRSVSVWRGNGDGTFQPSVRTALAPWSMMHPMAAADFNGDGNMDLVYSAEEDYMTEWGSVEVLLGDGQGAFPTRHLYQLQKKNPVGLAVADLNADGRPDVVTTNYGYYDGFVSVMLGNGDGTLSYDVNSSNFPAGLYPTAVAVGDFTSDGVPDLVITGFAAGETAVLPGRGDGTFAAPIHVLDYYTGESLVAADFNGDGRLDVLTVGEGSDDYGPANLFLGHGNGTFEGAEDVDIGGWYPSSPATGDFNGDGRPDLAIGVAFDAYGTRSVSVLLNNGDWPGETSLIGDYNRDSTVDAADYVVWRKLQGTTVTPSSGADGNGDGVVDQDDYGVWRTHFGQTASPPAAGNGFSAAAETDLASLQVSDAKLAVEERGASEKQRPKIARESAFAELAAPPTRSRAEIRRTHPMSSAATTSFEDSRRNSALLSLLSQADSEPAPWPKGKMVEFDQTSDAGDSVLDTADEVFAQIFSDKTVASVINSTSR